MEKCDPETKGTVKEKESSRSRVKSGGANARSSVWSGQRQRESGARGSRRTGAGSGSTAARDEYARIYDEGQSISRAKTWLASQLFLKVYKTEGCILEL
jgi:hypothetical protein